LRIQRAMELLRQNISPTEAAYLLSFSDRRAFAKVFKKITGVSPAHFQQSSPSAPVPMRIFRA
jgi:AraC-like DNA-binding protein